MNVPVDEEFIDSLRWDARLKWWVARRFPCRWVFGRKMCKCGPGVCRRDR